MFIAVIHFNISPHSSLMGVVSFLSIFVSASIIIDHKHHPHDVIAGMIMGGVVAVLVVC